MKKIDQLEGELRDIKHSIENEVLKPAQEKRLRKRIPYIRHCIKYLESEPKESFVKSEIQKCEDKITIRMSHFVLNNVEELDKKTVTKLKKAHEKLHEIPKLREQVRTLRYILK